VCLCLCDVSLSQYEYLTGSIYRFNYLRFIVLLSLFSEFEAIIHNQKKIFIFLNYVFGDYFYKIKTLNSMIHCKMEADTMGSWSCIHISQKPIKISEISKDIFLIQREIIKIHEILRYLRYSRYLNYSPIQDTLKPPLFFTSHLSPSYSPYLSFFFIISLF